MTATAPSAQPSDDSARRHHLDMIQRVVDRLAGNSAQIKTWTIAMLAALLLFSRTMAEGEDRVSVGFAMLALTVVFSALDGYYLRQERLFRRLYDRVRQIDPDLVDYSMDVSDFQKSVGGLRLFVSVSLLPFYITLVMLCVLYIIVA